ncbi:uncharacterized protein SAPINGB_P004830 [Magnusiomyces paraingens]|uniref:Uncharacterized protein n=1 Tax=Magnusiomyces paraingens TaxID=2606893 RepID=A0A5E8BWV2_9ASCO|nr:uncharacterized protein SAPINGB_P004830 [Saprochaete ingens]VVT56119.1 unnamed protein product [Saprochaete ingens]
MNSIEALDSLKKRRCSNHNDDHESALTGVELFIEGKKNKSKSTKNGHYQGEQEYYTEILMVAGYGAIAGMVIVLYLLL